MPEIEIDRLTYNYPDTGTPSLKGVSLKISKGEFVAVIGANNSGKSTFCYALSGIVPHLYHGEIQGNLKIDGTDIFHMGVSDIAQYLGMVMQNPVNQLSGVRYSVFEEVAFGLENQGMRRKDIIGRVELVLSMTGLEDLAERSPYQLSGGQQQRLALAAALATEPSILVLDEPTTFLDPKGTEKIFKILHRLNRQGATIVIAEQKLEWIAEYADRVVALKSGEVVMDGSPEDVLTSPVLKEINLEWTRFTQVARLAREKGLWPVDKPLASSFSATVQGLEKK